MRSPLSLPNDAPIRSHAGCRGGLRPSQDGLKSATTSTLREATARQGDRRYRLVQRSETPLATQTGSLCYDYPPLI